MEGKRGHAVQAGGGRSLPGVRERCQRAQSWRDEGREEQRASLLELCWNLALAWRWEVLIHNSLAPKLL